MNGPKERTRMHVYERRTADIMSGEENDSGIIIHRHKVGYIAKEEKSGEGSY